MVSLVPWYGLERTGTGRVAFVILIMERLEVSESLVCHDDQKSSFEP